MKKEETVMALREEYLAGKTQEQRDEFMSRSIDRQYSALQTWKYRSRRAGKTSASSGSTDVLACLDAARQAVPQLAEIDAAVLEAIQNRIKAFYRALDKEAERRRKAEIAALERRQAEIAGRLEELRSREGEVARFTVADEQPAPPAEEHHGW